MHSLRRFADAEAAVKALDAAIGHIEGSKSLVGVKSEIPRSTLGSGLATGKRGPVRRSMHALNEGGPRLCVIRACAVSDG